MTSSETEWGTTCVTPAFCFTPCSRMRHRLALAVRRRRRRLRQQPFPRRCVGQCDYASQAGRQSSDALPCTTAAPFPTLRRSCAGRDALPPRDLLQRRTPEVLLRRPCVQVVCALPFTATLQRSRAAFSPAADEVRARCRSTQLALRDIRCLTLRALTLARLPLTAGAAHGRIRATVCDDMASTVCRN